MKMFSFLAILVVGAVLQADDKGSPTTFVGAYTLSKKACGELTEAGYNRAYISVGKDALKDEAITIQFYGGDARQDTILLGAGSRTPLGTAPSAKNKIKETWITTFESDVHVRSVARTKGKITDFTETSELKISGNDVIYTLEQPQHEKTLSCKLLPVLRKKEKVSACEQMAIHLDDEEVIEGCSKGQFSVEANLAGALDVSYLNVSLREDSPLSCALTFDKPMGKFAPKVENCEWN